MDRRHVPLLIAAAIGAVLLLWIIWPSRGGTRNPRGPEFPVELAEAIRDGIAMTREARRDAIDGIVSAQRWRLLAIVIGVCIPIIIAYLALCTASTKDPDEADVMARMIKESRILAKHAFQDIDRKKLASHNGLPKGCAEDPRDNPTDETPNNQ